MLGAVDADAWAGAWTADAHIERSVATERDARLFSIHIVRHEDVFDVGEGLAVPGSAQNRVGGDPGRERFVVRDVDPLVLRKAGMERDVHQAGHRAAREDWRRAFDRTGIEHAVAHDAQPAHALGDQEAPVREKCEAPRMGQPSGDDRHLDVALLERRPGPGTVAERRGGQRAGTWRDCTPLIAYDGIRVLLGQPLHVRRRLRRLTALSSGDRMRAGRQSHHRDQAHESRTEHAAARPLRRTGHALKL